MFSRRIDEDLELRLPLEQSAEESARLVQENLAHLSEWLAWVRADLTVEDSREFIRNGLRQFAASEGFPVQIVFRGRLAGYVSLNRIDWPNSKTEIGYWLAAAYGGRGLMTKSCRAMLAYAFDELRLNRVEIYCATMNLKSRAIPERLGFKQDGILRQAERVRDHFNDLVCYSMLAEEWRDRGR
jgi:ribosomal-protein-serine acetyltransferase